MGHKQMGALDKMMAGMLKEALPPEVLAAITPEKMKEYGDTANAFVADIKDRLGSIQDTITDMIIEQQGQREMLAHIMEGISNVGSDGNRKPAGKRAGSGDPPG